MTTTETTVTELTADSTGVWRVTTLGSLHVFDLDNCTYERPTFRGLICYGPSAGLLDLLHSGPTPPLSICVEKGCALSIKTYSELRF